MSNEEIQTVLNQLAELTKGQQALCKGQEESTKVQSELNKGQQELFKGQQELFKGQQELFKGLQELFKGQQEFTKVQNELIIGQQELQQSLTRIENEHGQKINALFDAREVQFDVNDRILETLTRVEGKLDRLTLKVCSHDAELRRAK
jgi:uncharacterized protein (DUF3084 family)